KGKLRRYLNIMIVFLLSGVWHGANITFLFWGALNGIYQVAAGLVRDLFGGGSSKGTGTGHEAAGGSAMKSLRWGKIIATFLLMTLTWVFFRAPHITDAFATLERLCGPYITALTDGTVFTLGLGVKNLVFVIAALILLIVADISCEKKGCDVSGLLANVKLPVRWALYYLVIIMILFSCNLSMQEFLYSKF
ncbi:MAG: hypothetical protein J6Y57_03835, partial [Lachnospiraceae bacterium]|nr:hypothetical protein [Lachnospiraceae bacterium]